MDIKIRKLADAMRGYCRTRWCGTCILKPACDKHFEDIPSADDWAKAMNNMEHEEDHDHE